MVAEMLLTAAEFMDMSMVARELLRAPSGERSRSEVVVGGREETQSWTSSDTFGFWRRLIVFFEDGFEVMTMTGPEAGRVVEVENGCEGR